MRRPLVVLTLVLAPVLALVLAACASESDDAPVDPEASEDALESAEPAAIVPVEGYEPIALEERIVTRAFTASHDEAPVGRRLTTLRKLTYGGKASVLVVDDETNAVHVVERRVLDESTRAVTGADGTGRYRAALAETAHDDSALDHLDTRSPSGQLRAALTIDMCQSSKPWEARLFDWLVGLANETRRAVPVGIAMTGGWAKAHPRELGQLRTWAQEGKLDITWVNHSFTHPLNCTPDRRTCKFLTAPAVDFTREVLDNERFMLRQDLGMSPLFRFPGLTHDARTRRAMRDMGLFALDANAWLAKGQPATDASVILLHGNGNEPPGIELFFRAMRDPKWQSGLRDGSARFVSPVEAIPR